MANGLIDSIFGINEDINDIIDQEFDIPNPVDNIDLFNTDLASFEFNQEVQQNQLGLSDLKFDDDDITLFNDDEINIINDNLLGGI